MIPISLIATAIGLGFAYAAAPGAVNTEAIRRGAILSARSTLLVETGSLIGDSLWAILALTGVTFLARYLAVEVALGIVGGFFLLRLAWVALFEAFVRHHTSQSNVASTRRDFATGVVFGLANPVGLAFWLGLGSSVASSGVSGWRFVFFFLGFFLGTVLWCIFISAVLHLGRRWIHPALFRWINILCGLVLGYFGIRVLWIALQDWLQHHISSTLNSFYSKIAFFMVKSSKKSSSLL